MDAPELKTIFPALALRSPEDTARLGAAIAHFAAPGALLLLTGELGAGKTALVSALGSALGASGVRSPTFIIEAVHDLPGRGMNFVHADLYRLDDAGSEADQLEEHLDRGAFVAVEWAERWRRPPVDARLDIQMRCTGEQSREAAFTVFGRDALERFVLCWREMEPWL